MNGNFKFFFLFLSKKRNESFHTNIPNIFYRYIFVYFFYKIYAKLTSVTLYRSMRVMCTDASVRFL